MTSRRDFLHRAAFVVAGIAGARAVRAAPPVPTGVVWDERNRAWSADEVEAELRRTGEFRHKTMRLDRPFIMPPESEVWHCEIHARLPYGTRLMEWPPNDGQPPCVFMYNRLYVTWVTPEGVECVPGIGTLGVL